MFIQTEATPNPNSLKFLPGIAINDGAPLHFASVREAANSPLAQALFTIPEVESVFLGADFITIAKQNDSDWQVIKPDILSVIMEHLLAKRAVINASEPSAEDSSEDSEIVKQIKELLETHIRPTVAQDGGDIVFHSYEDGVVKLAMRGSCSGCPSSSVTLKNGIENMLKHYVPEVIAVEAVAPEMPTI